jgi:hypothetical protein
MGHLGWRIWRGKGEPIDRVLLWWAFWSFAVLWITGTFFQHYFLQIIAPFSVLTAYGIGTIWSWTKSLSLLRRVVAQGVCTVILVIITIVFIKTDYKYFFSYSPIEQTVFQLKDEFYGYGIYNVAQHQIAYYIRAHTDPNEAIYVWGIAPQIFFLAQRRAATRYRTNYNTSRFFTDNPMEALRSYASTVMEEIKKSPPAYIVQIYPLESFPELKNFVRDYYVVDKCLNFSAPPYRICLYKRQS